MKFDLKAIQRLSRQLGINAQEIDAKEVIIKRPEGDLIIKEPKVTRLLFGGEEIWQVSGKAEEALAEEDIRLVMEKAGVDREKAIQALKQHRDIAKAILSLKKGP